MEAKKIIITGGATRIGAAIAKSLVSFDTKIVIHFNRSKSSALKLKKELENLGAETYLLKADLNNFKQTNSLIKNAYTKMKGLVYDYREPTEQRKIIRHKESFGVFRFTTLYPTENFL